MERRWKEQHQRFNPAYFKYEILEVCPKDDLDEREKFHIADQNTLHPYGFNIQRGGGKGWDMVWTDEMRAAVSAIHKGKKLSETHAKAFGQAQTGKTKTAETRARMSQAQKGKPAPNRGKHVWTDEERQRVRDETKARHAAGTMGPHRNQYTKSK